MNLKGENASKNSEGGERHVETKNQGDDYFYYCRSWFDLVKQDAMSWKKLKRGLQSIYPVDAKKHFKKWRLLHVGYG